jgi:CHAT domain-containing protein
LLRALYEEDGHDLARLPFGGSEARHIEKMAGGGTRLLAGREASEERLKSMDLGSFAVLHFATHGLLSQRDPRRSALLLAADSAGLEDGFLQAREVEQLRLEANLVVLAACRTARGETLAGAGVESLATAFFRAGARSVVGTLWDVGDRPAMRLMTSFYRYLAAGHSKIDALRRAKLDALTTASPDSDWAGFVLLGEPFGRVRLAAPPGRGPGLVAALLGVAAALALLVRWRALGPSPATRRAHRPGRVAAVSSRKTR